MPNTISRLSQYGSFITNEYDEVSETVVKLSGLGTYFAQEFTENVGIGTTLRANVYRPYNIIDSEFSHVTNTPGTGVYMRQNKSLEVNIYNEVDDYSFIPRYSITPSSLSVDEGQAIYFDVFSSNVSSGTTVYYEIVSPPIIEIYPSVTEVSPTGSVQFTIKNYNVGVGSTVYYDFTGIAATSESQSQTFTSGSFNIDNTNTNIVTQTISQSYNLYSKRFYEMNVRLGNSNGPIIAKSPTITILPASISATVSASSTSVTSNSPVTFTINVTGATSGTLNYLISGDVSTTNFSDGLLGGSFSYSSGTAQVTKTPVGLTTTTFLFSVQSATGINLATTDLITITPIIAYSTFAGFNANAVVGESINLVGQSGNIRTFTVTTVPAGALAGTKAIRFPVTWPSSSYVTENQTQNSNFSMTAGEFAKLQDVDYIFSGRYFGVYPISGDSESCCDTYSLLFDGNTLSSRRGSNTAAFDYINFNGTITNNSGIVRYVTDGSINSGSGLYGQNGYFYLF